MDDLGLRSSHNTHSKVSPALIIYTLALSYQHSSLDVCENINEAHRLILDGAHCFHHFRQIVSKHAPRVKPQFADNRQ